MNIITKKQLFFSFLNGILCASINMLRTPKILCVEPPCPNYTLNYILTGFFVGFFLSGILIVLYNTIKQKRNGVKKN